MDPPSWAMLGTLGLNIPELSVRYAGVQIDEPVWVKGGAQIFSDDRLDYLGSSSLVQAVCIIAMVACQFVQMGAFEAYLVKGGSLRVNPYLLHAGEAFNPVVLAEDPNSLAELKMKEIRNGCLAISMFRYYVYPIATGEGPAEGCALGVADPVAVKGMTAPILPNLLLLLWSFLPTLSGMPLGATSGGPIFLCLRA